MEQSSDNSWSRRWGVPIDYRGHWFEFGVHVHPVTEEDIKGEAQHKHTDFIKAGMR